MSAESGKKSPEPVGLLSKEHKLKIIQKNKKKRAKLKKLLHAKVVINRPDPPSVENRWSTQQVARPYVTVQRIKEVYEDDKGKIRSKWNDKEQIPFPPVFLSPIRVNIVKFIHARMSMNRRQPYAVFVDAGHQHSAESWGTGRAVSRIPRVSGGGTSRAGQGAFGNMCRSGRMFAPTKTWRKWHSKITTKKKRYATVSCIAASAVPSLVEARGHRISDVPEIPLVVGDAMEKLTKTKQAIELLEQLGAYEDVEKVKYNRKHRAGRGKMRDRRYVQKKGPLIVYQKDRGLTKAFRNLPGVETCHVSSLNVMLLAPGGTVGRFIIWTKGAFRKLKSLWGSWNKGPGAKKGFMLPRPMMTHPDLHRIINSVTIQTKLRAKRKAPGKKLYKKNPLKNWGVMVKLNPYAQHVKRMVLLEEERRKKGEIKPEASVKLTKKNHEWRKKINYLNILEGKTVHITKKKYLKQQRKEELRAGKHTKLAKAKVARVKAEEFKCILRKKKLVVLKEQLDKETNDEKKAVLEKEIKNLEKGKAKKGKRKKGTIAQRKAKRKQRARDFRKAKKNGTKEGTKSKKVKGAKVSVKAEEAKPFKTYDNDECMGKEAPVAALRKLKYIQGGPPKKGNNLVVLLWRKSYKSGYKFMPLYSALAEEFKNKPVDVVGVCVDRDKNAPAGFLKKYHNGPKGNFTTTFPICEEWAPANKVYPLKGRDVEKGFIDNMMDIHPGSNEISSIPHVFIVNSHGTIVWHQDHSERGARAPDHMDKVKEQLTRLLSGKPLMSVGNKVVEASDSESAEEEEVGDEAVGDMGDFFTNF